MCPVNLIIPGNVLSANAIHLDAKITPSYLVSGGDACFYTSVVASKLSKTSAESFFLRDENKIM